MSRAREMSASKAKHIHSMNEIIIRTSMDLYTLEIVFAATKLNVCSHVAYDVIFFVCFFLCKPQQRARQSTCIDPVSGKRTPFLEIFPEDLLCHASALSSLGLTLKFKYLVLHLSAVSILSWKTFFVSCF